MPEQRIDRIEGEFHYAIPHDDDTGIFAVYRKSDDGYVDDGLEGFEKHTIDFLDEQARHHREAALREIDAAAVKIAERGLELPSYIAADPRSTTQFEPFWELDGYEGSHPTITQALLAATEGEQS